MNVESKAYELFFGVISPVGVEQTTAIKTLKTQLEDKKYTVHVIKLSDLIKKAMEVTEVSCEAARINGLMDAGNDFRARAKRGDAVGFCRKV